MSNHYHLLLELEEPEKLSNLMARINRTYTHYYQRCHKSIGFLWQGRFKAQAVQKSLYLLRCGRYIERNPVEAGIVKHASEYHYSSARFYCLGNEDDLTTESPAFFEFGADKREDYINFLNNTDEEFDEQVSDLTLPVGNKEFITKLILSNGRYLARRKGRKPKVFVA